MERGTIYCTASATSFLSCRNGTTRKIKTTVSGNVAFPCRFQSWLQDEYRCSRAPPQRLMDRSCKGENCSTCAKYVRCRLGLCFGGRWEKDFGGYSKCIQCTKCLASGNDEDMETFQSHARTVKTFHEHQKLEASKNCRRPDSVLGADSLCNAAR